VERANNISRSRKLSDRDLALLSLSGALVGAHQAEVDKLRRMDRASLDRLTTEQLREEARKFQLQDTGERRTLIDNIMSHFERHGPTPDFTLYPRELSRGTALPPRTVPETESDEPVTASSLRNVMMAVSEDILRHQRELQNQQMEFLQRQQEQMALLTQMIVASRENQPASQAARERTAAREPTTLGQGTSPGQASSGNLAMQWSPHVNRWTNPAPANNAVKWLATQIPPFGGAESENVNAWIRRVEKVAEIHAATDGAVLLAASSKLTGSARRWYDIQEGSVIESWLNLRRELTRMFERKIPFYKAMARIEARGWYPQKETFDEYAIDKLSLMHQLELPAQDVINLLIGGISQPMLRATALSLRSTSVEHFLETMRHITSGIADDQRRRPTPTNSPKQPSLECRNCGKKGHIHQNCRAQTVCFYCKVPGHRQFDCPSKKPGGFSGSKPSPGSSAVAAAVTGAQDPATAGNVAAVSGIEDPAPSEEVAAVRDPAIKLEIASPLISISSLCDKNCKLIALVDTGSPVSFVKKSVYTRYCSYLVLKPSSRNLRNLCDQPLDIEGSIKVALSIDVLSKAKFNVELFVISNTTLEADIILGREFLFEHRLTLVYKPADRPSWPETNLFTVLPLHVLEDSERDLESVIEESQIDFGYENKEKLKSIVLDVNKTDVPLKDDGHAVHVRLRDNSIFAYAPRRFAHSERLQLREITDDLLNRGIIKPSVSPYCARVVPVRKRSGDLRLCVDLRPLNARVERQRYSFPVIEECLSRLASKNVFTLLDLRDGFHQIRVHPDSTKFFSFATPDGQFEYTRLPFGYCESPAEFQKRLIQVLQSFIRNDEILVYIDDILIPSVSVAENLQTLRKVMLVLKQYGFELNLKKCLFLRQSVEFLGYIVSPGKITLSTRHVNAIEAFKTPSNVHEVQRFLGLASYFRRFIENFAGKAQPLYRLLRKSVPFDFNLECEQAFAKLKKELCAYPVLRLYDPSAETEVHTDACAQGLGAMLLQRQTDKTWSPVAYYSHPNSETEKRYHSFELEMLAVVRAIERFHIYLYGMHFRVVTDCNALVYAINKANLNPRISRWILTLQNYNFDITHRPGNKMNHVDALSRSVGAVDEFPLERKLEYLQLSDLELRKISRKLEVEDDDRYSLVNGLVYRKVDKNLRFVVPESMIHNVLKIYHDDMAHCGTRKTLEGISLHYWFPHMRRRTQDYIDNCITCLTSNSSANRFEGETQLFPLPAVPMDVVHMDHFGPLQQTKNKHKYILVIIDAFSRFVWLFAVKSTGSKETIRKLEMVCDTFGNPAVIVSDRGTAFTSSDFENFVHSINAKHRKVAVAAPWANGMVERINRFLKNSLIKVLSAPEEWEIKLGRLQYTLNNTFHASIKTTPSKLLLGYHQRCHEDYEMTRLTKALAETDNDLGVEELRNKARQTTEDLRGYNKMYKDAHCRKPSIYSVGDYVLIRDSRLKPGTNTKLKQKYKGPYVVKKVLGSNRYVITDIPGFNIVARPLNTVLSSDRIKPWVKPL